MEEADAELEVGAESGEDLENSINSDIAAQRDAANKRYRHIDLEASSDADQGLEEEANRCLEISSNVGVETAGT